MQRLQLHIDVRLGDENYEAEAADAAAQLTGVLAACGTAGSLTELDVNLKGWSVPLLIGGWAAALQQLPSLQLGTWALLRVDAPLHHLTALRSLAIDGCPTIIAAGATLPPSITHLTLGRNTNEDGEPAADVLPHQVRCRVFSALARIAEL